MGQKIIHATEATNLADILERVLDKGIVIAGDIKVNIADIELLSIQIRLVICSVDKAQELGINWWKNDPFLSTEANLKAMEQKNQILLERIEKLEQQLKNP
jgi:hypothetical protein